MKNPYGKMTNHSKCQCISALILVKICLIHFTVFRAARTDGRTNMAKTETLHLRMQYVRGVEAQKKQ